MNLKNYNWPLILLVTALLSLAGCKSDSMVVADSGVGGDSQVFDADGDDIPDNEDSCPNTINEGVDADSDGIDDACDSEITSNDTDGDGILNDVDNCPMTPNKGQKNTDSDLFGDACDADDDGDGVEDSQDNCPLVFNDSQADRDGDGTGDSCDIDADNDGVDDKVENPNGSFSLISSSEGGDNCPLEPNGPAQDSIEGVGNQTDSDDDGIGDACDPDSGVDSDGDGIVTGDNCPDVFNPGQENTDEDFANGDGLGDACDVDMDADGVNDKVDLGLGNFESISPTLGGDNCPYIPNGAAEADVAGVGNQTDTDGDNIGDACDAVNNALYQCGINGEQYTPMLASDSDIQASAQLDSSGCLVNELLGTLTCNVENPENVVNLPLTDFATMSNTSLLSAILNPLGLASEVRLNVAANSGFAYPGANVVGVAFEESDALLELDLQGGDIAVRTLLNNEVVQDSADVSELGLDLLGLSGLIDTEETPFLVFQTSKEGLNNC